MKSGIFDVDIKDKWSRRHGLYVTLLFTKMEKTTVQTLISGIQPQYKKFSDMYFTHILSRVCHNVSKQPPHPKQKLWETKIAKQNGKTNTTESKIVKTLPLCVYKRIYLNDPILLILSHS